MDQLLVLRVRGAQGAGSKEVHSYRRALTPRGTALCWKDPCCPPGEPCPWSWAWSLHGTRTLLSDPHRKQCYPHSDPRGRWWPDLACHLRLGFQSSFSLALSSLIIFIIQLRRLVWRHSKQKASTWLKTWRPLNCPPTRCEAWVPVQRKMELNPAGFCLFSPFKILISRMKVILCR